MRILLFCAASVAISGCAGSPVAIKSDASAREVVVDGVAFVVSGHGARYAATHRDFLANNLIVPPGQALTRKLQFVEAIERATGCRVTDTAYTPGGATLQAAVKC